MGSFLIRVAAIFIGGFLIYKLVGYFSNKMSNSRLCPVCDGKGYWESVRDREQCKRCAGTGKIPK